MCSAYYQEKYAPNNVFFVVVGDVRTTEVVEQISKAYEQSKAKAMAGMVLPQEPRQTAAREIIEEAPIELGYFHMAWHIPDLRHPDVPVLDVLATLLGSGRSSRLYQEVREKQGLVHSADAWTYSPGNPGLFGMSAMADPANFITAREAMLAELQKMKDSPVSEAELSKAKKQFISGTLASRKTMQGQAQDLGSNWLSANDLNFSERYLTLVKQIKPADLQRVAATYLSEQNRTLYALLPTGTAPKTTSISEESQEHAIQKFELPNGLRLLVKEDHRLPFVEFRAVFKGGVLGETLENNGVTQLMGKLLLKGTRTRSAEQIALEIESLGAALIVTVGNNSFGVNAEVLSSDFGTGLDLVADVLLNPTFPATALDREREVQLASIRAQKDHLLQSASKLMRRQLFGESGYGLDALGQESSVQKLGIADLQEFHDKFARPNNCVLAIFGDVKAPEVLAAVSKAFGKWQALPEAGKLNMAGDAGGLKSIKRISETRDKKQAVLVIGFKGTTLHGEDRYPLELLQESCSDLGSRLFVRIRDNLGLAYYVGAQNFVGLVPGYFAFYCGTMPEKAETVEKELLEEAALLRAEGVTQEELERSKMKVIGQKKIARQDLGSLAMTTSLDELYGLGYDHIDREDELYRAVTLEQLKEVARKYLTPDSVVIATIRP